MTNPYAAPQVKDGDEPDVPLPDGVPCIVSGGYLFCRSPLVIDNYCYITGSSDVTTRRNGAIACLPETWRTRMTLVLWCFAIGLISAGILGYPAPRVFFPFIWIPLCLGLAVFSFLQKKVKLRYGLSEAGKRARWNRSIRIGLVCGISFVVAELIASLFGIDGQTLGVALCFLLLPTVMQKQPTASRCADGVFRIRDLPPELLANLSHPNADSGVVG